MKRNIIIFLLTLSFLTGCNDKPKPLDKSERLKTDNYSNYLFQQKKINSKSVIDSIILITDFSMKDTAEYKRTPKATLFINEKARTKFQVFEDPKETITAIAYFRENKEINIAEYYQNGQVMCLFTSKQDGQREGPYTCYHEDGTLRITGLYKNNKEIKDSTKRFEK
jgi:antitoxin component YwqK of YwqJK toxin-antitoxin module